MRILFLLGLVAVLLPSVAVAQTTAKQNFGSYTCLNQPVPCADNLSVPSEKWAEMGTACLSFAFGYTDANGYFNDISGLDTNGCLGAKSGMIPKGMGVQLSPLCCVVEMPNNLCVFHCDLVVE